VQEYIKTNNLSRISTIEKQQEQVESNKLKNEEKDEEYEEEDEIKYIDIELSNMRKVIAKRLVQSKVK
jgi:hypothetical protein